MKLRFYNEDIVQKARKFKKEGLSAAEIARHLKVGDTTILRWCADIPSNNPYHLYARKLRNNAKRRSARIARNIKITKENAKILASILYWCEGSKYPSTNFISFSNSDVNLVKTFLNLFQIGFQPDKNRLKVHLQLHTTHNKKEIIYFWSKLLKIPESQFYKPTFTEPTKNMKRRNYKGTCTIRYYDVYLLLEMMGIFEEFSKEILKIK